MPNDLYETDSDMPAAYAVAVTPSDTDELADPTRGLYIGASGDLKVTTQAGDAVTFVAVVAGTVLPVRVKQVFATGTTAASIVALR